jgi:3-dehydroquinate dehydratase
MRRLGPDIVKIVSRADTQEDNPKLGLNPIRPQEWTEIISFCMGERANEQVMSLFLGPCGLHPTQGKKSASGRFPRGNDHGSFDVKRGKGEIPATFREQAEKEICRV